MSVAALITTLICRTSLKTLVFPTAYLVKSLHCFLSSVRCGSLAAVLPVDIPAECTK
jgi:hypothetical protein